MRTDWYQLTDKVVFTLFCKNISKDSCKCSFNNSILFTNFVSPSGQHSEEYHLAYSIKDLTYSLSPMKLEITLYKTKEEMWKILLKDDKIEDKAENIKDKWSKLDSLPEEEERNDEDIDSFFKKIYGNADSESKRAMIKSFTESGGTVLSTDWNDVHF